MMGNHLPTILVASPEAERLNWLEGIFVDQGYELSYVNVLKDIFTQEHFDIVVLHLYEDDEAEKIVKTLLDKWANVKIVIYSGYSCNPLNLPINERVKYAEYYGNASSLVEAINECILPANLVLVAVSGVFGLLQKLELERFYLSRTVYSQAQVANLIRTHKAGIQLYWPCDGGEQKLSELKQCFGLFDTQITIRIDGQQREHYLVIPDSLGKAEAESHQYQIISREKIPSQC